MADDKGRTVAKDEGEKQPAERLAEKIKYYRDFALHIAETRGSKELRKETSALLDKDASAVAQQVLAAGDAEKAFMDRIEAIESRSGVLELLSKYALPIAGLLLALVVLYYVITSGVLGTFIGGFGGSGSLPPPTPATQQAPDVAKPSVLTEVPSPIPGVSPADFNEMRNIANARCLTAAWNNPAKAGEAATTFVVNKIGAKPKGAGFDITAVKLELIDVKLNPPKCPTQ